MIVYFVLMITNEHHSQEEQIELMEKARKKNAKTKRISNHNKFGANIFSIHHKYPEEINLIMEFIERKYPNGVFCTHCGSTQVVHRTKKPKNFQCNGCNNSFSVFTNTIFKKTRTDLRKWLYAIHMIINGKKGVSAYQLQRGMGGDYRTSWRMMHQIRKAMSSYSSDMATFETIIEVDETYVGGKPRKGDNKKKVVKRGRGTEKTPVIGVYDRTNKKIHAKVALPNKKGQKLTGKQLLDVIEQVASQTAEVHTDEFRSYRILGKNGWTHLTVDHSVNQFANNGVHVNNVETFWSLLKRGIMGSFHHISDEYLQAYINEFCWRYNNRYNENILEDLLDLCVM